MPYIPQDPQRQALDQHIENLATAICGQVKDKVDIVGLLNYCITRVILISFKRSFGKLRYWMSPMIRGTLQDVGDEFYWRKMRSYEDGKIAQNGDVPEYAETE